MDERQCWGDSSLPDMAKISKRVQALTTSGAILDAGVTELIGVRANRAREPDAETAPPERGGVEPRACNRCLNRNAKPCGLSEPSRSHPCGRAEPAATAAETGRLEYFTNPDGGATAHYGLRRLRCKGTDPAVGRLNRQGEELFDRLARRGRPSTLSSSGSPAAGKSAFPTQLARRYPGPLWSTPTTSQTGDPEY